MLDDEEYLRILEKEKSGFIFSLENNRTIMLALGKHAINTGKLLDIDEQYNELKSVTKEQIKEASNYILNLDNVCLGYVGNKDKDDSLLNCLK